MSVVVAVKKDGIVYVGADSQVTCGGTRSSLSNPNNYKIWKVRGVPNCLMGHVGTLRDACAIRILEGIVREIDVLHNKVDFDYVVERIEPIIKHELVEHEFIKKDDPYGSMSSKFLFVFQDQLFTIEYGAVVEHDDFVAIGSGESEAIGSLITTSEDNLSPKQRIVRAIKATACHDLYVDYPIVLIDSYKTQFEVLDETSATKYDKKKVVKGEKVKQSDDESKKDSDDKSSK